MHDSCWGNAPLYDLLNQARASYSRYGQIAPLDKYDQKAVIYAARATYLHHGKLVCEWLSLRFVPYSGTPWGFEDADFYLYGHVPAAEAIQRFILSPNGLFWSDCVSGSRICGIGPYLPKPGVIRDLPKQNRSAGLCFAAMHKQFFREHPRFKILISQIPDSFLEKVLATRGAPKPQLTTVVKALRAEDGAVYLNRKNRYIYKFPMYFLNPDDVLEIIRNLYTRGEISEATLIHYFGGRLTGEMIKKGEWPAMSKLSNLGLMLNADGRVYGSQMTGEDMRIKLCAARDGPKLRIIRMKQLKKVTRQMLGD